MRKRNPLDVVRARDEAVMTADGGPGDDEWEAALAHIQALVDAALWVCGEGDSDFYGEGERKRRGLPIYWWRSRLHKALVPFERGTAS